MPVKAVCRVEADDDWQTDTTKKNHKKDLT
jgi:hypothetical protein